MYCQHPPPSSVCLFLCATCIITITIAHTYKYVTFIIRNMPYD